MGQDRVCISISHLQFAEVQNSLKTMNQDRIWQLRKGMCYRQFIGFSFKYNSFFFCSKMHGGYFFGGFILFLIIFQGYHLNSHPGFSSMYAFTNYLLYVRHCRDTRDKKDGQYFFTLSS